MGVKQKRGFPQVSNCIFLFVVFLANGIVPHAGQIDHDLDHLYHNLQLLDVVRDLCSTDPTQEKRCWLMKLTWYPPGNRSGKCLPCLTDLDHDLGVDDLDHDLSRCADQECVCPA